MSKEINKTRIKELKTNLLAALREIEETAKVLEIEDRIPFNTEMAETIYKFKKENGKVEDILVESDCVGPAHEYKTLSITGALYLVRDGHLLEYANDLADIKSFINEQEPDRFSQEHQREWLSAKKSIEKLIGQVHTEFFERVSVYSYDREASEQLIKNGEA